MPLETIGWVAIAITSLLVGYGVVSIMRDYSQPLRRRQIVPFGGDCEYRDFQDCVNKNRDKDDPEAYCATIQRATEQHCKDRSAEQGEQEAYLRYPRR